MTDPLAPLFHDLTPRLVEQALDCFTRRIEPAGTSILLEGDLGGSLLVVADGEVEIRTGDLELGIARAGDILGEIGLFAHGARDDAIILDQQYPHHSLSLRPVLAARSCGLPYRANLTRT